MAILTDVVDRLDYEKDRDGYEYDQSDYVNLVELLLLISLVDICPELLEVLGKDHLIGHTELKQKLHVHPISDLRRVNRKLKVYTSCTIFEQDGLSLLELLQIALLSSLCWIKQ